MQASGMRGAPRLGLALLALAALGAAGEPPAGAAAGGAPRAGAVAGVAPRAGQAATPATGAKPLPADLPPIVFVARTPPNGADPGQVPGLGPHGTFAGSGGRLLERSPDGRVRELLPAGRLHDVADPDVSADGRTVAFSGRETPLSAWRIWTVARAGAPGAGGSEPRCRTCGEAGASGAGGAAGPADDADPAWWGDTLLFVSTRGGGTALYDGSPATQLWALAPDGSRARLTHEPNGVLDPVADRARRRVLFARWWFNPWRMEPPGVATRGGEPGDTVNVWQLVSARLASTPEASLALEDLRLAAGGTLPRRGGMGLQPARRGRDGVLAVAARNTGLAPRPGALAILAFARPPGAGSRVAGAAIGTEAGDAYREGANLAAPAACAPAPLPDGGFVCALDPGGRGEFGLCRVSADGTSHVMLVDEPGRWELDPTVVPASVGTPDAAGARPSGAGDGTPARAGSPSAGPGERRVPAASTGPAAPAPVPAPTFRYLSRDVFAGAGAPPRRGDAVLHVFRAGAGDTAVVVRRTRVPRSGRVDLRLPADVPLFEVLADPTGRALTGAHGIAQVRGFNPGAGGSTSRCAGCHLGHSTLRR
jgi:hypothetical protein